MKLFSLILKSALLILILLLSIVNVSAQSKKAQIENLNLTLDSLTQILINDRLEFSSNNNKRNIEFIKLKSKIDRMLSINDSLNTQLAQKKDDNLILNKQLSFVRDSVNNLNHQIAVLNKMILFSEIRNSNKFETFLNYFLFTAFSKKNIDSLIYFSSPLIKEFTTKEIELGRFWNMGAFCNLYKSDNQFGYNFYENFGLVQPDIYHLNFFSNKEPEGGFCDPATSPDGIYYKQISNLPENWDLVKGISIPAPSIYNNLKKMIVYIQYEKWIIKNLYFVEYNTKWYLLYIYDCDCSA